MGYKNKAVDYLFKPNIIIIYYLTNIERLNEPKSQK